MADYDRLKMKNEQIIKGRGLINEIFSWSISDVLNKYFYNQVKEIPKTFSSVDHYMNSFKLPLIEETHVDLLSSITRVSRAPFREICSLEESKFHDPDKDLLYAISLRSISKSESDGSATESSEISEDHLKKENDESIYKPEIGDLIVLTSVKPNCTDDLKRPEWPYLIAYVCCLWDDKPGQIRILTPEALPLFPFRNLNEDEAEEVSHTRKMKDVHQLFAVYLTNLSTNIRIWQALSSELEWNNHNIIKEVLATESFVDESCSLCHNAEDCGESATNIRENLCRFKLNDSQEAAVLSCIAAKECHHRSSVKLIWGPPGTGKTQTIGSLLFTLLKMKCRTLACAPTNIAVLGTAQRLLSLVKDSLEFDNYGLGDIVLFGNKKRMKINDNHYLHNVFIDNRVSSLSSCLNSGSGWKKSLEFMICLLEDSGVLYNLYLKMRKEERRSEREKEKLKENIEEERLGKKEEKVNSSTITSTIEVSDDEEDENPPSLYELCVRKEMLMEKQEKKNGDVEEENDEDTGLIRRSLVRIIMEMEDAKKVKNFGDVEEEKVEDLKFEEFLEEGYNLFRSRLINCIPKLCTHLPTSFLSLEVAEDMIRLLSLLKDEDAINGLKYFDVLRLRGECLQILGNISDTFSVPDLGTNEGIKRFCLSNSCLVFCTASSSVQMHTLGMNPLEFLVIDEAALLKECESAIPLQLPGLRHTVLVGDEKQLPAMVQSKISERAEFGRSLFQRLVILGHQKHLLNIQYRMHPKISQFPNKQFYENMILNGFNVKEKGYERSFLNGGMYGPYSFIDVSHGKEEVDNKYSTRNMIEVAVIADIIERLYKECVFKKQKVSVGCISPYKAQVFALQQKLGNKYERIHNFTVSVRSVDGFQGGEEDIIIISTVRSNWTGSIGFLSNHNRTNVALTRARYCLWIVGSGSTLMKSGSVWNELVLDAESRYCFYKADDDKNLAQAIVDALTESGQLDNIFKMNSSLLKEAKWKVCFDDEFMKSISRPRDVEIRKKVIFLLLKLSSGWRLPREENGIVDDMGIEEPTSQLLEIYRVDRNLYLLWTVDILMEKSVCMQIVKVWYIAPFSKIKELAKNLGRIFGNYTVDRMNRCKFKRVEEDLVLPITWPTTPGDMDTSWRSLSSQLSRLRLQDEPQSSGTGFRHDWKSNRYKGKSYEARKGGW